MHLLRLTLPTPIENIALDDALLDAAEAARFDVLLTTDRNIRYQQNLTNRKIAIVILGKGRWRLIKNRLPEIAAAVAAATPGSVTEVEIPVD